LRENPAKNGVWPKRLERARSGAQTAWLLFTFGEMREERLVVSIATLGTHGVAGHPPSGSSAAAASPSLARVVGASGVDVIDFCSTTGSAFSVGVMAA